MLLAYNKYNNRIRAKPGLNGFCPECSDTLIPKCGTEKIWHWAHHNNAICSYGEGIGVWHLRWQDYALQHGGDVEVPMVDKFGNKHRADIIYKNRVIELQHSNISESEIISRSNFYVGLPEKRYRCDWLIDYSKQNFIDINTELITANGNHKKGFDCLFRKLYGNILFDLGNGSVFYAKKLKIHKEYDSNDFGTKVRLLYYYIGHTKQTEYFEEM